jgi:hypothetical protein
MSSGFATIFFSSIVTWWSLQAVIKTMGRMSKKKLIPAKEMSRLGLIIGYIA